MPSKTPDFSSIWGAVVGAKTKKSGRWLFPCASPGRRHQRVEGTAIKTRRRLYSTASHSGSYPMNMSIDSRTTVTRRSQSRRGPSQPPPKTRQDPHGWPCRPRSRRLPGCRWGGTALTSRSKAFPILRRNCRIAAIQTSCSSLAA
jgi:hypothetical protein